MAGHNCFQFTDLKSASNHNRITFSSKLKILKSMKFLTNVRDFQICYEAQELYASMNTNAGGWFRHPNIMHERFLAYTKGNLKTAVAKSESEPYGSTFILSSAESKKIRENARWRGRKSSLPVVHYLRDLRNLTRLLPKHTLMVPSNSTFLLRRCGCVHEWKNLHLCMSSLKIQALRLL